MKEVERGKERIKAYKSKRKKRLAVGGWVERKLRIKCFVLSVEALINIIIALVHSE